MKVFFHFLSIFLLLQQKTVSWMKQTEDSPAKRGEIDAEIWKLCEFGRFSQENSPIWLF